MQNTDHIRVFSFLMLVSVATFASGQHIPEDRMLRYDAIVFSPDTISCPLHGFAITNDTLVVAFRKAMIHYPELCNRKIQVRYGNIKTSMAAQPHIWSIFCKRSKRSFKVIINKDLQKAQTRLIYAAPFNAHVGIMGHELAHILDYSTKSGWQTAWTGVRYLGKKYRRKMERQTDSVTIARGLGWQLYHYAYFVIHESAIDDAYRQFKLDVYMKPEEIFEIISSQTN